jgi:hypothetical protein
VQEEEHNACLFATRLMRALGGLSAELPAGKGASMKTIVAALTLTALAIHGLVLAQEVTSFNAEEHEYVFRGVATGDTPMPEGYEHYDPNDFTIPTLREVC